MKPARNITIVLVVILALCAGLYFIVKYEPAKENDPAQATLTPAITIFQTDRENVKSVTITNPDETYVMTKKNDKWVINDDETIKISQSRADTLIYDCTSISVKELIEENPKDLSAYGLDAPKRKVEVVLNDGQKTTVLIGNTTIDGSLCYLMLDGENKVYTKSASGTDSLAMVLAKLRDNAIYSLDEEDVRGFTLERKGAEKIVLEKEFAKNDKGEEYHTWKMRSPLIKEANEYNLSKEVMETLTVQNAVSVVRASGANLSEYGLADPAATYQIQYVDNGQEKKVSIAVGSETGENTYLKETDKPTVYTVATEKLKFLNVSYLQLVDKLIHLENIENVDSVTVSGKGSSYEMVISGSGDTASYAINGKSIEEKPFKAAYQAVLGLTLEDFTKTGMSGTAEYTITYHKKDGTQSKVECIPLDERSYVVTVNGEGNLIIRKKQVENMIQKLDETLQS